MLFKRFLSVQLSMVIICIMYPSTYRSLGGVSRSEKKFEKSHDVKNVYIEISKEFLRDIQRYT